MVGKKPSGGPKGEGALRGLVGAGPSQVGVSGAMRARDVSRPRPEDDEAALTSVVIRRRNPPPKPAPPPHHPAPPDQESGGMVPSTS